MNINRQILILHNGLVDHCHGVTAWPLNMSNINTRTQGCLSAAHDEHVLVCHMQIP